MKLYALPLGGGGGGNRGSHRGNWIVDAGLGGIPLFQQRNCCIEPTGEAKADVGCPYRPIRTGRPQDKYTEDGDHGLPAMPRACKADNGDRSGVLRSAEDVVAITGVRS